VGLSKAGASAGYDSLAVTDTAGQETRFAGFGPPVADRRGIPRGALRLHLADREAARQDPACVEGRPAVQDQPTGGLQRDPKKHRDQGQGLDRRVLRFIDKQFSVKQLDADRGGKTVLEDLGAKDPKVRELKPENLIDTRFLRELKDSEFIK